MNVPVHLNAHAELKQGGHSDHPIALSLYESRWVATAERLATRRGHIVNVVIDDWEDWEEPADPEVQTISKLLTAAIQKEMSSWTDECAAVSRDMAVAWLMWEESLSADCALQLTAEVCGPRLFVTVADMEEITNLI